MIPDDKEEPKAAGIVFGLGCALVVIILFVLGFLSSPHEPLKPLPVPSTTTTTVVPGTRWVIMPDGYVVEGDEGALLQSGYKPEEILDYDPRVTTTRGTK